MTIYLIDGTAQAYRAFHAIPPLSASNGFPTNAIVGFINMLRKLTQDESPEFIGVAFDVLAVVQGHEKRRRWAPFFAEMSVASR